MEMKKGAIFLMFLLSFVLINFVGVVNAENIDFELKRADYWANFNPNDVNANDYLFGLEICVHGNSSINDLKSAIPGLEDGLPFTYSILGRDGKVTPPVHPEWNAIGGYPEEMKNGQCDNVATSMQFSEQILIDNAEKIIFKLDQNNIVSETNENNNQKEVIISSGNDIPSQCTDTDGSKSFYRRGKAYGTIGTSDPETDIIPRWHEDYCIDDTKVYDFACKSDIFPDSNSYTEFSLWTDIFECPDGCKEGACLGGETESNVNENDLIIRLSEKIKNINSGSLFLSSSWDVDYKEDCDDAGFEGYSCLSAGIPYTLSEEEPYSGAIISGGVTEVLDYDGNVESKYFNFVGREVKNNLEKVDFDGEEIYFMEEDGIYLWFSDDKIVTFDVMNSNEEFKESINLILTNYLNEFPPVDPPRILAVNL